jgi:serine phosphatase RsbU (regulator of sigma subunit)
MLDRLNAALIGHAARGFVTCCCARLTPDGRMTIANAGHLPHYSQRSGRHSARAEPRGGDRSARGFCDRGDRPHRAGSGRARNAGHQAPYLDGAELEREPRPPLGIDPDASYPERELTLGQGQQLTFVADGVAEAAKAWRATA